VRSA